MRSIRSSALALCLGWGGAVAAESAAPLAVIDWLVAPPDVRAAVPALPRTPDEPPVTRSAARPRVATTPLGAPTVDGAGLLPAQLTGFPPGVWRGSDARTVQDLLMATDTRGSAVMQRLFLQLVLSEAEAPLGVATPGAFLTARADAMRKMGAVDQAIALLEHAGLRDRAVFEPYFELALLSDRANPACEAMSAAPHLSRDVAARVFCLARTGEWMAAATTLDTSAALGLIPEFDAALLAQFLDPEFAEDVAPPALEGVPTPLQVRLLEALGALPPNTDLPVAYAVRDLSGDAGWKAQITAAERLAARGALDPARLFAIYRDGRASASGGVWERVSAVQKLDTALAGADATRTAWALEIAVRKLREAGLLAALADQYAPAIRDADLPMSAAPTQVEIASLSTDYGATFTAFGDAVPAFAAAVATGEDAALANAGTPLERTIANGLTGGTLRPALAALRQSGKTGELILRSMALYLSGREGDPRDVAAALAGFRAAGLEDVARRAALELLSQSGTLR
ncbi:hypothetical protein [Pseudaestuariivita sp.]|uniref:hypothetical protein n=1 Tax=Pseudaestuariivita sp. TaxID=2211669 RepID=UPI0040582D6D